MIYNERETVNEAIPDGGVVGIAGVSSVGTDVSYDNINNAIHINADGTYLFMFFVNGQTFNVIPLSSLLTLEMANGTVLARSGTSAQDTHITGFYAGALTAGTTIYLRNRGGGVLTLMSASGSGGNSYTASMTVVRVG